MIKLIETESSGCKGPRGWDRVSVLPVEKVLHNIINYTF
jgi:hypothetical protein